MNDFNLLIEQNMSSCTLCPRNCNVNRLAGKTGYCKSPARITAARAALHFYEEPCISGHSGSGAVFFSGCNLQCLFCQNLQLAKSQVKQAISIERLSDIYLELQDQGANNINLVTGSHYVPQIAVSLERAKTAGLQIPVIYNTSSYEKPETLEMLDGLIDVYLPDLKYCSADISKEFSNAPDYFEVATKAIDEMFRQVGPALFSDDSSPDSIFEYSDNGLIKKGVIVRHLCMPGLVPDTKHILRYLHEKYKDDIYISIMSQYTPLPHVADNDKLNRKLDAKEYARILTFAEKIGIKNGFIQNGEAASDSFIPDFNFEGLYKPSFSK